MDSTAILIAVAYGAVVIVGAGVFYLLYRSTLVAGEVDEQALATHHGANAAQPTKAPRPRRPSFSPRAACWGGSSG